MRITPRQLLEMAQELDEMDNHEGTDYYTLMRAPIPGNLAIMRGNDQVGHVDFVQQDITVYDEGSL